MLELSNEIAQAFIKQCIYLVFSAFALMIYMKIDQIMIAKIHDQYTVGIYSSAARISEAINLIPGIVFPSVSSTIFAARQKNQSLY